MSSGSPMRRTGNWAACAMRIASGMRERTRSGVSTRPGAIAFTVTPCTPTSVASARVKPTSAALAAA
jgi:hypothetical protein